MNGLLTTFPSHQFNELATYHVGILAYDHVTINGTVPVVGATENPSAIQDS